MKLRIPGGWLAGWLAGWQNRKRQIENNVVIGPGSRMFQEEPGLIRRPLEIVANLIGFICCVLEIYDEADAGRVFICWQIAESPPRLRFMSPKARRGPSTHSKLNSFWGTRTKAENFCWQR